MTQKNQITQEEKEYLSEEHHRKIEEIKTDWSYNHSDIPLCNQEAELILSRYEAGDTMREAEVVKIVKERLERK
jgi:hypothetical protein